jgi:diguanylate cyclase (GGDEF)-like protein/PAS domain S-box-containing protein
MTAPPQATSPAETPHTVTATAWGRLHAALMPDYNPRAAAYWWTMVLMGSAALALALWNVQHLSLVAIGQVLVGTVFAIVAGFFPVRIPRSKNSFVAGEVFIFLLLLMHGTSAASIASAGEAFVGACRSSRRWTSRIASPTMAALSMTVAGHLMEGAFGLLNLDQVANPGMLLLVACVVAVGYFVLNTLMVSTVITLKTNRRFHLGEFVASFGSIGIAYGGSALIAVLLHLTVQHSGLGVLLGALPVVAMLLTTVHYFLRQQEAHEAMQRGRAEAAEREAEQAARHVAALGDSERRFHSAFTHASIGMALVSIDGRVLQANNALASILGLADGKALAEREFAALVVDADRAALTDNLAGIGSRRIDAFNAEMRCRHASGAEPWVALHGAFFTDSDSEAPCLIVQVQDISARRHAQEQLNHIAFHDSLTGLPNRSRFHVLLAQSLAALASHPERHFAVMFMDFDRFKLINDSMGHSAGDEFLVQVSRRIQDQVRPGDAVARLGGDEFALLVHDVKDETAATSLAQRLLDVLKKPLAVGGVNITASASIGITFSRLGYLAPEEMLRDADTAMYRAKAAGKARYALFDAQLHTEVAQRVRMEAELRQAIASGGIEVAYQPMFHIGSGKLRGFEALARWNHPTLGAVSPTTFIPLAEEAGVIVELTDQVLSRACAQVRAWQALDPALDDLKLQVNLSGADLTHAALYDRVERVLRHNAFPPHQLTLELTENILMERLEGALSTLESLRRLGVALAIDDFGTGYSSLSYLSTLPIDSLKIDRSFVHGMRLGSKDAEIVRAIVSLGGTLGKTVVAEGIETESQLMQLHALGCEHGQGFHLSRPLSVKDVDSMLEFMLAETRDSRLLTYDTGVATLMRH